MFDIATFGSNVIDLFVNTNLHEKGKKMYYEIGSKLLIKDLKEDIGGGGTNTAVAFSRLGLKTAYIGKIGKDINGNKILKLLKKEKISFLGKRAGLTGISIILDSKEHDRTILTYKGVNNDLKFSEIQIPQTKWLYYSSLLGESFKTQLKLAKLLTTKSTKLALNPSYYQIKQNPKKLYPLLKLTTILILNKEEAQLLTKNKNLLNGLHKLGPKIICITNRDKPTTCYDGKKYYSIKPHKNIKVVERTGAGDAFASGFVAGFIRTGNIKKSLEIGLKNSESVIRYFGAKNKLLNWKDVK